MKSKSLNRKNKSKFLLLFISGLLCVFAFAPFYFFPVLFIAIPIFFGSLLSSYNFKQAFKKGFTFGFGFFLGNLYWICYSLTVEGLKFLWLVPFALFFIPAFYALYIGLFAVCFHFFAKTNRGRKKRGNILRCLILFLIFSLLWVAFEYLRGNLRMPFALPWAYFAYVFGVSNEASQIASISGIGILGMSFLCVFISLFPYLVFTKKKHGKKLLLIPVLIIASMFLWGKQRLLNAETDYANKIINTQDASLQEKTNIRIVQPNIPQADKMSGNLNGEILTSLLQLSNVTSKQQGFVPDVIIWPESATNFLLYDDDAIMSYIMNNIPLGILLISGTIRIEEEENQEAYNSMIFVRRDEKGWLQKAIYDKRILVPFGEYIPLVGNLPFIESIAGGSIGFKKGKDLRHSDYFLHRNFVFVPNICFETIFLDAIFKKNDTKKTTIGFLKHQENIVINITNDSWFGNSIGPYQHFMIVKMQAIANKIDIIRVANSGISAYINKYGKVEKSMNLGDRGVIDIVLEN